MSILPKPNDQVVSFTQPQSTPRLAIRTAQVLHRSTTHIVLAQSEYDAGTDFPDSRVGHQHDIAWCFFHII